MTGPRTTPAPATDPFEGNPLAWMAEVAKARNSDPRAKVVTLKFSRPTLAMWVERAETEARLIAAAPALRDALRNLEALIAAWRATGKPPSFRDLTLADDAARALLATLDPQETSRQSARDDAEARRQDQWSHDTEAEWALHEREMQEGREPTDG